MGNSSLLSLQKEPNPQGKGLVPVLQDWSTMRTGALERKSPADFLRDYCISSLVLSATFGFKPVVEKTYFLYARKKGLSLSLIAPFEWGNIDSVEFLGSCHLRSDMTWEMSISLLDEESNGLANARTYIREFLASLSEQSAICDHLPFYTAELPYYQRMLSTALASSLQQSLPDTGDDVKALLSHQPGLLSMIKVTEQLNYS
ncbi:MAG: DUF2452 domain-containing protein [Halioglobus sp.]